MKKIKTKIVSYILLLAIVFSSIIVVDNISGNSRTEAAKAKVAKIEKTYNSRNGKTKEVYTAKTSSGKIVWRYNKLPFREAAQFDYSDYCVRDNKVYIWAESTLHVLNKNTGKCILKKNVGCYGNGAIAVDAKGYIYGAPADGATITKLNSKGKVVWDTTVPDKYSSGCTYDIKISNGKLKVYCEFCDYEYFIFNSKTGKFIKPGPKIG